MIRELHHLFEVLLDRAPFKEAAMCRNLHFKRKGNSVENARLAHGKDIRCPICGLPMWALSAWADTDHHIARAAAYYRDGGQP